MQEDLEKQFFTTHRSRSTMQMDYAPAKLKEQLDEVRKILKLHPTSRDTDNVFVQEKEKNYWFELKTKVQIGRHKDNDLVLDSPFVSARHCVIDKIDKGWTLKDLNSSNGVYINNRKIDLHFLVNGDIIQISHIKLIFISRLNTSLKEI